MAELEDALKNQQLHCRFEQYLQAAARELDLYPAAGSLNAAALWLDGALSEIGCVIAEDVEHA